MQNAQCKLQKAKGMPDPQPEPEPPLAFRSGPPRKVLAQPARRANPGSSSRGRPAAGSSPQCRPDGGPPTTRASARDGTDVGGAPFRYRALADWSTRPAGWGFGEGAGVATDSPDRVFVFNRGA